MYSKQALLDQHHQMFCVHTETVRLQLTSMLRNGSFQHGFTKTIGNAFYLYSANSKVEIPQKKDKNTQKNYNCSNFLFIVNKPYSNNTIVCFVSTQKQSASSLHPCSETFASSLAWQEQSVMHSFYNNQILYLKFEIHKKDKDSQNNYNCSHFLFSVNKPYSNNTSKCFVSTTKSFRFQLSTGLRNVRCMPVITKTIGNAFFSYVLQILNLKFT